MQSRFYRTLLAALSDDATRPHLCRVHVRGGEARATDGHRLHVESVSAPDGDYEADGVRVGDVDATCFHLLAAPTRIVDLGSRARELLKAEMLGYPKALTLRVPLGPGDWLWGVAVSDSLVKARIRGPREIPATPADLVQPRPAWWGGADAEGPTVYVSARYLLDALSHTGGSEVGLGDGTLDPVACADGRGRWALVMPIRT